MQKAFDLIVERLETETEYQYMKSDEADELEEISVKTARNHMALCYEHSISIVNQVAEEYSHRNSDLVIDASHRITSLDEVINRLQYKADNIKAKLEPSYFTECIDYLRTLNDGWILLTDDEDSYPKPFEYVLVQDDIGDKNVAYCDADYDWYISNGEDSLKLIGDIIAWQPLPQPYVEGE